MEDLARFRESYEKDFLRDGSLNKGAVFKEFARLQKHGLKEIRVGSEQVFKTESQITALTSLARDYGQNLSDKPFELN